MQRTLDFIVIGAQKAGTTSFFEYVQPHPEIFIPPEKEAPFFCLDDRYDEGWAAYVDHFFADAPPEKQWGTITPHYMGDVRVPRRIGERMPDVRLAALLRNPIDRAFSHYRMTVRRGGEDRSFDTAVDELSRPECAEAARQSTLQSGFDVQTERNCYLTWSEYGRILDAYLDVFDRDQMLVSYTDELAEHPRRVLRRFFTFLDVDPSFVPSTLGNRYHDRSEESGLFAYRSRKGPVLNAVRSVAEQLPGLKAAIVSTLRSANRFYLSLQGDDAMAPAVRRRLRDYFAPDVRRLTEILGERPPWPEFFSDSSPDPSNGSLPS